MQVFFQTYGEAAFTATGFFWKAGWAFVLGYAISAMIQVFIPKARLTRYMGRPSPQSITLATLFGAISSSCSFAALAAARALVMKGAHFVAAVAFMFASTNLVIELGILILIFLGWQFLAAEIVGGVILIFISTLLIMLTYPRSWMKNAREKVQNESERQDENFNPWHRLRSREGWLMVGNRFVMEWQMVWEEILIGFTVAGFVAAFVPPWFWETIFLADQAENASGFTSLLITLENAAVAPFVAAATFIGSMGNIPLATVLNANGVLFAGIMGFIYSDLMVPPLVAVNAKYYGWRVALYIAAIMFVAIVLTALILHYSFAALSITPESGRRISDVAQFKLDYTFWMNLAAVATAGILIYLRWQYQTRQRKHDGEAANRSGLTIKRGIALSCIAILLLGWLAFVLTS